MEGAGQPPAGKQARLTVGENAPGGPPHFRGKSEAFVALADVRLEVAGVFFPAHRDVLLMHCGKGSLFEGLFQQYTQAGAGAGSSGAPTIVLSRKPAKAAAGRRRRRAEAEAPAAPEGPSTVTPASFQLFLNHLYDRDAEIATEADAVALLDVSDFFGAETLKSACDVALTKLAGLTYEVPPSAVHAELAARYRLPKLAAWHAAALMRSLHSSSGWALYRQVSKEELQGMVEGLGVPIKDALIKRLAEIAIVNQLEFAAKLQQGWHKRT